MTTNALFYCCLTSSQSAKVHFSPNRRVKAANVRKPMTKTHCLRVWIKSTVLFSDCERDRGTGSAYSSHQQVKQILIGQLFKMSRGRRGSHIPARSCVWEFTPKNRDIPHYKKKGKITRKTKKQRRKSSITN